jgi:predicted PurR-regulated permease PerM
VSDAKFWKYFLIILVFLATLYMTVRLSSVVLPFVLGLVVAYVVYPVVDLFVSVGLRRDRVVLVFYAGL